MTWHHGALAAVDTETTGVDIECDRIVTACITLISPRGNNGARPVKSSDWLADPGVEISEGASAVHGITTEYAREHGSPAVDVAEEFSAMCALMLDQGIPLVGMNISFDLSILDRECHRYDLATLNARSGGISPVIDCFVLDKYVDPYRKGKRNLTALCEHYRVRIDGAHDASADAIASARVAWRIAEMYPEIGNMKLDDLHAAQVRWKREQAESFRRYLIKQGKDASDVRPEWPYVPRATPEATLC